jgi:glycosyltransferase involved in cell wall biosynthesis
MRDAINFSIVTPTFNYGHYLARAMDSVLTQPGDDFEMIVVDDGSTDDTAETVRRYQTRSRALSYIYQQNRGLSAARNRGVKSSRGRYLLFLDADDALLPTSLQTFRSIIDEPDAVDFVLAGRIHVTSKGLIKTISTKPLSASCNDNVISLFRSRPISIVNGNNVVHRRVFDRLSFPETVRLWEDRVFYAQLFACYSGKAIADPVVTVYSHHGSLSHNVDLVRRDGPKTVDLLFDPAVLPSSLMPFRAEYEAVVQGILFDTLYASGLYQEAVDAFHKMMQVSSIRALPPQRIRRYLKMKLALLRAKP